jgi:hypothetical protein
VLTGKLKLKFHAVSEERVWLSSGIPQMPCTGDLGFKIITTNCHKTPKTQTVKDKFSA